MSAAIQVSIVEDEAGLRRELETLVNGAPGFCCLKAYSDGEAALDDLPANLPDLVLMDINPDFGISGDTTRKHMARIYEKLHVHSRTEAILKFLGRCGSRRLHPASIASRRG